MYRSTRELEAAIHGHIDAHSANPKPFRWINSADDIPAAIKRCRLRTLDIQAGLWRTSETGH